MSIEKKKILSIIVYYTLAILAVLSAGFFLYCCIVRDVVLWAKIVYFVWIGLVIGTIIFDVICTTNGEAKEISGLIVYILSLLSVIMACILYFLNVTRTGLATDFFNLFLSVSIVSLMTSGYMIATWCVGESLVEHTTSQDEIQAKRNRA